MSPETTTTRSGRTTSEIDEQRIRPLTPPGMPHDDSVASWRRYFWVHLLGLLEERREREQRGKKLTFVYGDTHMGGRGELHDRSGWDVPLYNCGGWVVENRADHPACHVFAVTENGEEWLLDVSFRGVQVDGEPLLQLAAIDAENRGHLANLLLSPFSNLLRVGSRRVRPRPRGPALRDSSDYKR